MKKNNKRYLNSAFALLLSGFALVSCNDNEVDFVYNQKPTVTVAQTSYTVNEGEFVSIVLTPSRTINTPIQVKLELLPGGTATIDDDFSLPGTPIGIDEGLGADGFMVTIPANASSYTVKIPTVIDDAVDDNETFAIRLSGTFNLNAVIDQVVNVTIKNVVKDELDLTLSWDKTFSFGGQTYSLCEEEYDIDILVFDAATLNPFGNGAQTGDCPEHLNMPLSEYPDGEYIIAGYLYNDIGLPSLGLPEFNIPITVDYLRGGSSTLSGSFTQSTGMLTSNSQGDSGAPSGGNGDGDLTVIVRVKVQNGVFTILNGSTVLAQGKSAAKMIDAFKVRKALKHKK